ncbi:acyclic terpene utilization AtuA family protein [Isoptericola sp. NPDC057191]|uniref:acyclic terpene utilization AtuA family protein n=1 Tax=Isoptericola sp. NPDC057191 TaxID=3346041 RepID=UPI003631D13B
MEIRVLAPTGVLGGGFTEESLEAGLARRPHVIACDAGSTDSGPSALGSGVPKLSDAAVRRDLRLLLLGRARLDVPLVVGSCGTSGRDVGVDGVAALVREIAEAEGLSLRLALIYSDQPTERLESARSAGRIRALEPLVPIEPTTLVDSHVVAMMGSEPIERALSAGADVVLAGRASDTALFAALPHLQGADAGLTWHAAKTVECGAACAVPPSADGLLVYLRDDHFDVEALQPGSRLTAQSVAAHTLYENADPFLVVEPSGVLDTSAAEYEQISETMVRVRGARFHASDTYTNKLEGARLRGFQTVAVGGVRDRIVIARLKQILPMANQYFTERIQALFAGNVDPADVDIRFTLYGDDAVLGEREPLRGQPAHEIGVLLTVTAATQEIAHAVGATAAHVLSHLPIPEYDGLVSTVAYPFSPPEMDRGAVYEFTLNSTVVVDDPSALFRTEFETIVAQAPRGPIGPTLEGSAA